MTKESFTDCVKRIFVKTEIDPLTAWRLVISESALASADHKTQVEFIKKLEKALRSKGWKFENVVGSVVWKYDITNEDVNEVLQRYEDEQLSVDNSLKFLLRVNEDGTIA